MRGIAFSKDKHSRAAREAVSRLGAATQERNPTPIPSNEPGFSPSRGCWVTLPLHPTYDYFIQNDEPLVQNGQTGRLSQSLALLRSNCDESQAKSGLHISFFRNIEFRMVNSLCIQATMTTLLGFPFFNQTLVESMNNWIEFCCRHSRHKQNTPQFAPAASCLPPA